MKSICTSAVLQYCRFSISDPFFQIFQKDISSRVERFTNICLILVRKRQHLVSPITKPKTNMQQERHNKNMQEYQPTICPYRLAFKRRGSLLACNEKILSNPNDIIYCHLKDCSISSVSFSFIRL